MTQEELKRLLHYEPATGQFTWRVRLSNRATVGKVAGSKDKLGYVQIGIAGVDYKAHRLAWLYMTGELPSMDIDHINGVTGDNQWSNLRHVTHAVNGQNTKSARVNNKSGFLGVVPYGKRFRAQITLDGWPQHLGYFDDPASAHQAYVSAKRQIHEGNTL